MINNIQDLFIKYNNINSKNKLEDILILFFKKELNIELKREDFKINIKNKIIYLNKNKASFKFFLKTNLTQEKKDLIQKEIPFKIIF